MSEKESSSLMTYPSMENGVSSGDGEGEKRIFISCLFF